jgi:hypothetical protein
MWSREEQETTVTGNRKEGVWYVWTADPVHRRKFEREAGNGRAVIVGSGDDWAEFKVQAKDYDPAGGFKRRKMVLTDAQRAERAERLRNARNAQ